MPRIGRFPAFGKRYLRRARKLVGACIFWTLSRYSARNTEGGKLWFWRRVGRPARFAAELTGNDVGEEQAGKTEVFSRVVAYAQPRMLATISNLCEERDQKKQAAAELRPCSQRRPRRTASARKDAKRPTAVWN